MHIIWILLIGLIAGWLAGKIMHGGGYGIIGDIVVGIIGSVIGGYLFRFLGIASHGFIGAIVTAFAGAIVCILILRFLKRS